MENMTALVSAFARAYHYRHSDSCVFADEYAGAMLTAQEYADISENMTRGISYFAPGFRGRPEEALRWIVNHQLAPSVLVRSAFCERAMENAARIGCRQMVLYAAGYDTFALRTRDSRLNVYELDRPEMIVDKMARVARSGIAPVCHVEYVGCDLSRPDWMDALISAGFDPDQTAFGSLLGLSYYLTQDGFAQLIGGIASISCAGSSICFDYPLADDDARSQRTRELAEAAGTPMKARYTYVELEALLSKAGFLIYEHMNSDEATDAFFTDYNFDKRKFHLRLDEMMSAPRGVGYCLAVRKHSY